MTNPRRCALLVLGLLSAVPVGCGSAATLVVRPTTPAAPELVPTQQLQENVYKRILLLPPENGVNVAQDVDIAVVKERGAPYYVNRLEKLLLSQGFEVISQEIVARVGAKAANAGSAAARALVLGKETHAEAVLMVQSIQVVRGEKFYHGEDFSEVEPSMRVEDDGEYRHKESDVCLFRLPYYQVRLEAKMIDVQSGNVLWVGAGRESTLDALKESWTAKLDDECAVEQESPFIYRDELQAEATLDRTVGALYERMFTPMRKAALAGKPIVREEPKPVVVAPPPPPPPPPEPPKVEPPKEEPPKPKVAVVSSTNAQLREGPSKRDARIRTLPRKAKVEVVDTMGEWIKVKVQDGTVGWMHESALIVPD